MEKGSRSSWRLALATFLAYLAIPVGCSGGYGLGTKWTGAVADRSEQVVIDEAHPLQTSIAVVAAPADAPGSAGMIYGSVRNPERDVADFRLKHPGYSFLPKQDWGHISLQEAYVDYRVVQRDSGKALIKTHYNLNEIGLSTDIRATYEATESDVRLISYRVGSDSGIGIVVGSLLAFSLALLAKALKKRLEKSPAPSAADTRWVVRLRKISRALVLIAVPSAVVSIAAGWELAFVAFLSLLLLAAIMDSFLRSLESPGPARTPR